MSERLDLTWEEIAKMTLRIREINKADLRDIFVDGKPAFEGDQIPQLEFIGLSNWYLLRDEWEERNHLKKEGFEDDGRKDRGKRIGQRDVGKSN